MKTTTDFLLDADRYQFDSGECSWSNGYAQLDTRQDAPYYGAWAHPADFVFVEYAEGDFTRIECDDAAEFVKVITEFAKRDDFKGIDPGWNISDADPWKAIGLTDFLHDTYK